MSNTAKSKSKSVPETNIVPPNTPSISGRPKPTVGQVVWLVMTDYRSRAKRGEHEAAIPGEVVSVGRKYFTVRYESKSAGYVFCYTEKFRIEDWGQETGGFTATVFLYETAEQYAEKVERIELARRIRDCCEALS